MKNKKTDISFIQVLGIMSIFILIYAVLILQFEIYSHHDIKAFHTWSRALLYDTTRIYELVYVQYPLLGYWIATWVFKDFQNWQEAVFSYRLWLIMGEYLILSTYYYIFRIFVNRKRSLIFSIFITALPSVYSSSSLFGQIDGFIHLFIVLSSLFLIKMYEKGLQRKKNIIHIHFFNILYAICLIFAIHTKQLSFFPGLTLAIFYLVVLFLMYQEKVSFKHIVSLGIVSIFLLIIITRGFDRMVVLSESFYTIYQFLLTFRSDHLSLIGKAPNIWLFFIEGSPKRANDLVYIGSVSILHLGYFLTFLSFCIMLYFIVRTLTRFSENPNICKIITKFSALLFLSISFITLSSYIFMAGMYGRFAIFCFPFYLLGMLVLWSEIKNKKWLLFNTGIAVFGTFIYGGYIILKSSGIEISNDYNKIWLLFYVGHVVHQIYLLNSLKKTNYA